MAISRPSSTRRKNWSPAFSSLLQGGRRRPNEFPQARFATIPRPDLAETGQAQVPEPRQPGQF
jgi:hypothetical protein